MSASNITSLMIFGPLHKLFYIPDNPFLLLWRDKGRIEPKYSIVIDTENPLEI